jgi:nucleotide-binding universal stress UspA family protein
MNDVIVVGTDGSDTATAAVLRAGELAKKLGARVELVSGWSPDMAYASAFGGVYAGDWSEDSRKAADGCLDRAAKQLRAQGLEVEVHCMQGDAADALIDVAEATDASMIVVGSKGMTGGKRFLLGSVPNRVSHHAPCSVMIVRTN